MNEALSTFFDTASQLVLTHGAGQVYIVDMSAATLAHTDALAAARRHLAAAQRDKAEAQATLDAMPLAAAWRKDIYKQAIRVANVNIEAETALIAAITARIGA